MVDISILTIVYKSTYNWGAQPCKDQICRPVLLQQLAVIDAVSRGGVSRLEHK